MCETYFTIAVDGVLLGQTVLTEVVLSQSSCLIRGKIDDPSLYKLLRDPSLSLDQALNALPVISSLDESDVEYIVGTTASTVASTTAASVTADTVDVVGTAGSNNDPPTPQPQTHKLSFEIAKGYLELVYEKAGLKFCLLTQSSSSLQNKFTNLIFNLHRSDLDRSSTLENILYQALGVLHISSLILLTQNSATFNPHIVPLFNKLVPEIKLFLPSSFYSFQVALISVFDLDNPNAASAIRSYISEHLELSLGALPPAANWSRELDVINTSESVHESTAVPMRCMITLLDRVYQTLTLVGGQHVFADSMSGDSTRASTVSSNLGAHACVVLGDVGVPCAANRRNQEEYEQQISAPSSDVFNGIKCLTGLNQLYVAVGANFTSKEAILALAAPQIVQETFIIDDLLFGVHVQPNDFFLEANGAIRFALEEIQLGFKLYGSLGKGSFALSASTLDGVELPITKHISLSRLLLSIGIERGQPAFGLTSQLNIRDLSIFFALAIMPPRLNTVAFAISSVSKRMSLKTLIENLFDIEEKASLAFLDVIAVGDLDLQGVRLNSPISNYPTDILDPDYTTKLATLTAQVVSELNSYLGSSPLGIKDPSHASLLPLGRGNGDNALPVYELVDVDGTLSYLVDNSSGHYILSDNDTLRQFHIDNNGGIGLDCQFYLGLRPTHLGGGELPVGLFLCGTLFFFGVRLRFLLLCEKDDNQWQLLCYAQMTSIDLFSGLLQVTCSDQKEEQKRQFDQIKKHQSKAGLASVLIDFDQASGQTMGPMFYFSLDALRFQYEFIVTGHISLLKLWALDTLISIRNGYTFVHMSVMTWGIKMTLGLECSYQSFSDLGFAFSVSLDTSAFAEAIHKAQQTLKKTAEKVKQGADVAIAKLEDAKKEVAKLDNEIAKTNSRIDQCVRDIKNAPWWKFWIAIARGVEIAALEVYKVAVIAAKEIALAALTVLQGIVNAGSKVIAGCINAIATVIGAVTTVFFIKSMGLSVSCNTHGAGVSAHLVMTIFGKDVSIGGSFGNGPHLEQDVKGFVNSNIDDQANKTAEQIDNGQVDQLGALTPLGDNRFVELNLTGEAFWQSALRCESVDRIAVAQESYQEALHLRDESDALLICSNDVCMQEHGCESDFSRFYANELTVHRTELDSFNLQSEGFFDQDFANANEELKKVLNEYVQSPEFIDNLPSEMRERAKLLQQQARFEKQVKAGDEFVLAPILRGTVLGQAMSSLDRLSKQIKSGQGIWGCNNCNHVTLSPNTQGSNSAALDAKAYNQEWVSQVVQEIAAANGNLNVVLEKHYQKYQQSQDPKRALLHVAVDDKLRDEVLAYKSTFKSWLDTENLSERAYMSQSHDVRMSRLQAGASANGSDSPWAHSNLQDVPVEQLADAEKAAYSRFNDRDILDFDYEQSYKMLDILQMLYFSSLFEKKPVAASRGTNVNSVASGSSPLYEDNTFDSNTMLNVLMSETLRTQAGIVEAMEEQARRSDH